MWKPPLLHWVLLLVSVVCLTWFSTRTSLGNLDGFDTTFYANMVCGNIGLDHMNTISPYFGTAGEPLQKMYTFQSYYYLASVLVYVCGSCCSLLHITFDYMPAFFWIFQILYFMMVNSLHIMAVNDMNHHKVPAAVLLFAMTQLYFQKVYFNNVFGFFGNTYRTMLFGYAFWFLYRHFRSSMDADKYLFALSLLAACAVSSSAVFTAMALLVSVFFVAIEDHPDIFREYALLILFPLIDLVAVFRESLVQGIICGVVFSLFLWFAGRLLYRLFIQRRYRYILLAVLVMIMAGLSFAVTRNPFDFSAFFVNGAELYDMSINYFNYYSISRAKTLYSILCLVLAGGALLSDGKDRMIMVPALVFIIFLNPFCCSILLKFNSVYSRMYDLLWNPFTLVLYTGCIFRRAGKSFLPEVFSAVVFIAFCILQNPLKPIYYHPYFVPEEHYNWVYRMSDEQLDIIRQMQDLMSYDETTDERIITANKLTQPMLNRGEYYLVRHNFMADDWTEAEKQLYWLFYPDRYTNNEKLQDPDYAGACSYLAEAKIDYLVVDKTVLYYNPEFKGGTWVEANYFVNECGTYPAYENERYALYRYSH